jgi:putative transposase
MSTISYARFQFPPTVIQHAVWLYLRFNLSLRDVEDLLAERGLDVSYETVRRWVARFGTAYAKRLRERRPRPDDRWHLDEMFVSIGGRRMYLWRAVDAEGEVLDILVQPRRDKRAAMKLLRRLLKRQGAVPSTVTTDKLGSYRAALRDLGLANRQVTGGRSNNRAENSHQPVRRRERCWIGFKDPGATQRFLSANAAVYNAFNLQRHLISRRHLKIHRAAALAHWKVAAGVV